MEYNKEFLSETLFIDIETAGDHKSFSDLPDHWLKILKKQHKEDAETEYQNTIGLRPEISRIVCIGLGRVTFSGDDEIPVLHVGCLTGTENSILSNFSDLCTKVSRLCAHNGKNFDFPFISKRMVAHSVYVPALLDVGEIKPWEVPNLDLLDMWRFGGKYSASLDAISATLGHYIDDEVESSEIHDLYWNNQINKISNYCAVDIVKLVLSVIKLKTKFKISQVTSRSNHLIDHLAGKFNCHPVYQKDDNLKAFNMK